MDINKHNERAWDLSAQMKNRFTLGLDDKEIEYAKNGDIDLLLTPKTKVPDSWITNLKEKKVLVLAGAGGRQAILLALAGAHITLGDISKKQLETDQKICEKLNLKMKFINTAADNLDMLKNESFDLIVNPLSNCFFEDLDIVWKACSRVLKKNGEIIYAFNNPISYLFDFEKANRGEFHLKYSSPYSDLKSLDDEERKKYIGNEVPLEFGHSLSQQMATLMKYNMAIIDMFEDSWDYDDPINSYFPAFINIRARKYNQHQE